MLANRTPFRPHIDGYPAPGVTASQTTEVAHGARVRNGRPVDLTPALDD